MPYYPPPATGGSGSVATDTIWDAKGDDALGTGSDTAAKLTVGANGTVRVADSTQSTGHAYETKGAGTVTAAVETSETTTSTTYADLTTDGPNVTATIGITGKALVIISARFGTNSGTCWMSFGVGATTPADVDGMQAANAIGNAGTFCRATYVSGLTPGSVTFNSGYKTTAGTASFVNRKMTVIPL